jgi:hypothetical protein
MNAIDNCRDDLKREYATGWSRLGAVNDRLAVLTFEGNLSADDYDRLHTHLREAFAAFDWFYHEGSTRLGMAWNDPPDVYSDGSAVYSTVSADPGRFPPDVVCFGDLGPADSLEPGTVVIVELPLHLRELEVG